jgi:hypothetical protein
MKFIRKIDRVYTVFLAGVIDVNLYADEKCKQFGVKSIREENYQTNN